MNIVCNGEERQVAENTTVEQLIAELGLQPEVVVAECDGTIVPREIYGSSLLRQGSKVELIRFVGGG